MIANPNDGNSPRVEVATPIIDVSAEGLITATTEQEAGYVPGGSKSATQQLPTQGAKTVTPGTTNQTAVASGRYTTGDVDVAGDANLKAENIAEGVSIFGVAGTHSGQQIEFEFISVNSDKVDANNTPYYEVQIPMNGKSNIIAYTDQFIFNVVGGYIGKAMAPYNIASFSFVVAVEDDVATISGNTASATTISIYYFIF